MTNVEGNDRNPNAKNDVFTLFAGLIISGFVIVDPGAGRISRLVSAILESSNHSDILHHVRGFFTRANAICFGDGDRRSH
jgi:hypothetical protein